MDELKVTNGDSAQSPPITLNHKLVAEKAKEMAIEAFLQEFPINFYWIDSKGYILGVSNQVMYSLDLNNAEEIIGKHSTEIVSKLAWENTKKVIETCKTVVCDEVHVKPDGSEIIFLTIKSPYYDENSQLIGVVGVSFDVTKQRKYEALLRAKKTSEATINRLKAIAGSIVHQIGDPLGTVKIASEFNYKILQKLIENYQKSIQKKGIKPNISDQDVHLSKMYADQIQLMIEQTGFIINNHLINIKHNSWHTETDWIILKPESISKIVEKALAEHPFTPEQKLLVHWQKGEDFNILGIDNLISNVISNLLNNALKSIERAKKGEITIWLTQDKQFNYLHIKDTGDGLPHAGRQEIFKPFHSNHEGTGLGLYFCKSVMQGYNGDITCRGQKKHPAYAQFTLKFLKCATAKKIYRKKIKTV